ncbi:MAG: DUF1802 family protein [Akkermansiaceae bacterium]|nr:DUF1802 family protein [Akkermansiaceae bacterium]NNM29830.1 DUF1802 family protein [Akkermansiaceae bacterium]
MNGGVDGAIGYKEWEAVCEAMGAGRQGLLLRKGGIHEGRSGFAFKHERFFLFPTRFHAQAGQVRVPFTPSGGEWEPGDDVPVRYYCEARWARTLTDWERVRRLEPFHVWSEEVVRERFDCGEVTQIHCALVRVHALRVPWVLEYGKQFGGCRTWVTLPDPPEGWRHGMRPVIEDGAFGELCEAVENVL